MRSTPARSGSTRRSKSELPGIQDHLTTISGRLRSGVGALLRDAGVTVLAGDVSFARYDRVSIAHDQQVSHLEFDNCVLATGSRPVELTAFSLDHRIVSSTGALALSRLPESMAVIGGGYIGIELGTAFAKLGVNVTIIEATETILPGTAPQLRAPVERKLDELGVVTHTGIRADHPTPDAVGTRRRHQGARRDHRRPPSDAGRTATKPRSIRWVCN